MDDRGHPKRLGTISPAELPANHEIPIPSASLNQSQTHPSLYSDKNKTLPLQTPATKQKEKLGSNMRGLLIELAMDGSEDGTGNPVKNEDSAIPLAPTQRAAGMTAQVPTLKGAGMTPKKPTNHILKGTPKPDWPGTTSWDSSSSDNDTDGKE